MMITIKSNDVINSARNGFYNFGHEMIGTGVALTIDKLAHKIFDIEENTYNSYAVKFGSCLVGYVVCSHVAPQTPLIAFTGRVACELFVMGVAGSILLYKVGEYVAKGVVVLSFCGPVGNFASKGLISTFLLSQKVAGSVFFKGPLYGSFGTSTRTLSFNGFSAAFEATGLLKVFKDAMATPDSEDIDNAGA